MGGRDKILGAKADEGHERVGDRVAAELRTTHLRRVVARAAVPSLPSSDDS